MSDINDTRIDTAVHASVTVPDGLEADPSRSHQTDATNAPTAITAGYRGMLGGVGPEWVAQGGQSAIWSMALIKTLEVNFFGPNGYMTVEEILPTIIHKVTSWEEYEILLKSMQAYGQQVPIRVFSEAGPLKHKLRDGINRIALAEVMGWDSMLVTQGLNEYSMWEDWDNTTEGKAFHKAKARRFGVG